MPKSGQVQEWRLSTRDSRRHSARQGKPLAINSRWMTWPGPYRVCLILGVQSKNGRTEKQNRAFLSDCYQRKQKFVDGSQADTNWIQILDATVTTLDGTGGILPHSGQEASRHAGIHSLIRLLATMLQG